MKRQPFDEALLGRPSGPPPIARIAAIAAMQSQKAKRDMEEAVRRALDSAGIRVLPLIERERAGEEPYSLWPAILERIPRQSSHSFSR